ncbi:MAG TPA: hypothetical protein VGR14_17075 [Verrucomicrobiae bacterium]|nr:hypothetical protein [Verrucomicrobiae bacterium]
MAFKARVMISEIIVLVLKSLKLATLEAEKVGWRECDLESTWDSPFVTTAFAERLCARRTTPCWQRFATKQLDLGA